MPLGFEFLHQHQALADGGQHLFLEGDFLAELPIRLPAIPEQMRKYQ